MEEKPPYLERLELRLHLSSRLFGHRCLLQQEEGLLTRPWSPGLQQPMMMLILQLVSLPSSLFWLLFHSDTKESHDCIRIQRRKNLQQKKIRWTNGKEERQTGSAQTGSFGEEKEEERPLKTFSCFSPQGAPSTKSASCFRGSCVTKKFRD